MNAQLIASYESEGYVNRPLSQKEIINMLVNHGLDYRVFAGMLVTAEDLENDQWIDTTGWMLFDLLAFLNY